MNSGWLPTRDHAGKAGHGLMYGLFGSWFLATLVSQDPTRKHSGFRKIDPIGLFIADWRFFAPKPGMDDNHLLYRDELADGSLTNWKEVEQDRHRRPIQMVFYPTRRGDKALTDAVSTMLLVARNRAEDANRDAIQLTIPYVALLNFVTNQLAHHRDAVRTEFVLATSQGYDETREPEVVFLSNRHPLTSRPDDPSAPPRTTTPAPRRAGNQVETEIAPDAAAPVGPMSETGKRSS